VKQIEESELEQSIKRLSGYIDELDDRVQVLEKEFNRIKEVTLNYREALKKRENAKRVLRDSHYLDLDEGGR